MSSSFFPFWFDWWISGFSPVLFFVFKTLFRGRWFICNKFSCPPDRRGQHCAGELFRHECYGSERNSNTPGGVFCFQTRRWCFPSLYTKTVIKRRRNGCNVQPHRQDIFNQWRELANVTDECSATVDVDKRQVQSVFRQPKQGAAPGRQSQQGAGREEPGGGGGRSLGGERARLRGAPVGE